MGGNTNDALAKQRRNLPWLVLAAVIAASPGARKAIISFLRSLIANLRNSYFLRPAVRKDFLGAGVGKATSPAKNRRLLPLPGVAAPPPSDQSQVQSADLGSQEFFHEFDSVLPSWLSEGLCKGGFQHLKPIQRKILPLALAGRDVCGVAPTGSGKTLAFLVPGLVHMAGQPPPRCPADGPIALVLAPTRELAIQIGRVADGLLRPSWDESKGSRGSGFSSAVLYGGARRTDQLQTLRFQNATHLVVATPGRLLDFLEHGAFTLHRVSFFVLDEGDRMLDFGFEPDVTAIARQIRSDRQMLFFSATWPPEVKEAALRLTHRGQAFEMVYAKPQEDEAESNGTNGNNRTQNFAGLALPPREIHQVVEVLNGGAGWDYRGDIERKAPLLLTHLEEALGGFGDIPGKALIFVGTRLAAEELGNLVARHFGLDRCGVMHGARKQDQREATLQAFRTGRIRALVATDVLGRGVDIPDVSHVVIYDFPGDIETYIHRVGRTGRNGQQGKSIAFYEPKPWQPDLARDLVRVLRSCEQDVPKALSLEAGEQNDPNGWNGAGVDSWTDSKADEAPMWVPEAGQAWRKAPALEIDSPDLATADELGEWHAGGARVWGYSANGGQTEQGRLELRSKGKLRTTWGWGEWALLPSAPHCPPPARRCPTPASQPAPATEADMGAGEAPKEAAAPTAWAAKPGARHLSLSWGGCTDVVALSADGLNFELVSRSGRPATTFKTKTMGRVLVGVSL